MASGVSKIPPEQPSTFLAEDDRGSCPASMARAYKNAGSIVTAVAILNRAVQRTAACNIEIPSWLPGLLLRPRALQEWLLGVSGPELRQAIVAGVLEDRFLFLESASMGWVIARLNGSPLKSLPWPAPVSAGISVRDPESCISICDVSAGAVFRLTRPRIKLMALCHPETFPLPRFPLGISALARAVRLRFQGDVSLSDMQLGASIQELVNEIEAEEPDIVGISATFGQHDLLERLADQVLASSLNPWLIFGGSLSALNASRLLNRYSEALVAHGPGEVTMQDLAGYWHGDLSLAEVRGVHSASRRTPKISTRHDNGKSGDFVPELDLLEPILGFRGIMQLEGSRGCTHACSFCPREHKGVWAGGGAEDFRTVLDAVAHAFDQHSQIARKIFLVDEEFVGNDGSGGIERARNIADELYSRGFQWETSSRIDQVYRPDKGSAWHVQRLEFWSYLRDHGLDRCLFGVESGVDSILRRFNKRTTSRQNVLAIRLLSACGIPIRCTYITFDHLMDRSELAESYRFQGREDLLLRPQSSMNFDEILEAVQDDGFAVDQSQGRPFYSCISYMLVSMECLIGSPYLRKVEEAGLARQERPSMGRRDAAFIDPLLGLMSDCSQRWVDRNFSFDYLLKSLEKITAGDERKSLRLIRELLKEYSYLLLGRFLALADHAAGSTSAAGPGTPKSHLLDVMDVHFSDLVEAVNYLLAGMEGVIRPSHRSLLMKEIRVWSRRLDWELINV